MSPNGLFVIAVGTLALISIIACVVLNNKRRIPHTASFQDDPAGATSDLLVFLSFLFAALFFVAVLMFGKTNNCGEDTQQANVKVVEKPDECKDTKK
jgi:hypothetical protein